MGGSATKGRLMKTRLALLFASVLILSTSYLLALPAEPPQRDRAAHPPAAHNTPRANQGRVPPVPPARSNRGEPRQPERLPTGHVNDTPHVNHDQWFGHEPVNDQRFRVDRPFAHGRFANFGPSYRYRAIRFDSNLHRFWFTGGFGFEVASWDWPLAADWCWNCEDDFVVYDDPDHPGWYLLYNVHTGGYVHVQYLGI
jgi:hypothetical protein